MEPRRYDALGFPVPIDFDHEPAPSAGRSGRPRSRTGRPAGSSGRLKRLSLAALAMFVILPAVAGPALMPEVRDAVVSFSLWRAAALEAEDDPDGAAGELARAIEWHGEDPRLLCMRATLWLEARDAPAAVRDATRARELAPTSPEPLRIRGLARICMGDADAALEDAQSVCVMSPPDDPHALNYRAYVRALVNRDLADALDDIDRAIASLGEPSAELLDTRGFILQLSGRHEEAFEVIDLAVDMVRQTRRQLVLLAGRVDRTEFARRLRQVDHSLAVMLHHRGLAQASLGRAREANEDFELAKRKGFDPSRGIF